MSSFCRLCNVSCPSDYQYKEHLNGKKHAAALARSRAASPPLAAADQAPSAGLASDRVFMRDAAVATAEFRLTKKDEPAAAALPPLPAQYRDLLKRKRDVNLYIANGKVVWQFNYDAKVIDAVKTHIKGRRWEPSLGVKGCWTCPIESLPEAVALY